MNSCLAQELVDSIDKIYPILDELDKLVGDDKDIFDNGEWLFYDRRIDCVRNRVSELRNLFKRYGGLDDQ